jgi:hypothetical protein
LTGDKPARERELHAMCECCQQPKKCETDKDPKTCTDEQIQECHGSTKEHACGEKAVKVTK